MLAMVFVASSAWAQTNTTPYIGGTYSYTLNDVTVQAASATATISYTDASHVTIPASFPLTAGENDYTFDITFNDGAVPGTLTVTITENGCSNFINLAITPQPRPALALSVAGSVVDLCQNKKLASLTNNVSAVDDGTLVTNLNTFTFVVTSTVTNVSTGTFDFDYDISLDNLAASFPTIAITYPSAYSAGTVTHTGVSADVSGTTVITDTYTINFQTVAGIADQTMDAVIAALSAQLTLTSAGGDVNTYNGTLTVDTDNVVIKTMPKIGTFTIE